MKYLYDVCKPRESVFDEAKRDDTLDLSDLLDGNIDGQSFFEETYVTDGMELLFDTAFKRFEGKVASGIIKLTQSMGGGKTHNMLALGVLAKDRELRKTALKGRFKHFNEDINIVSYTGRESDLKYGIWGEIAEQLGKKDLFADYYSPLSAPGQSAWIRLLQSDKPTLILLDELPPYLQSTRAITYGVGTLADITTAALANLFNAVGKAQLHNVCIVVSDLQATYEEGSQLLQSSFKELDNEVARSAINIEPVGANTDDLYNILRTRLFEEVGGQEVKDAIIQDYRKAIKEARDLGYTNYSADEIAKGIQISYPFHPSIRDLFARFKENPGFQQTRGYIRLMRLMVKDLYSGEIKAKSQSLINGYDINLNDGQTVTAVKGIKESISNAISHDIADRGNSVAEILDSEISGSYEMQDVSKLILVSSLANVSNAIVGLSIQEIIGYVAGPGRDIGSIKRGLDEFSVKAWYLYRDKANRVYFKDVKNVNAELIDLVNTYSYEFGKQTIKEVLLEKLKPELRDCYQEVLVFPSIDDIELSRDKTTLILTEPSRDSSGLNKDLRKFYEDTSFKNRIMFLTGQRSSMVNLVSKGKEYSAITSILTRMKYEENLLETDPQYKQAQDLQDKINLELLSSLRESFVSLYFPKRNGLVSKEINMKFEENSFVLEEQIRNLLKEDMKYDVNIDSNEFREKFEDRIFTQRQMTWSTLKERAASITSWSWHHPRALDDLKQKMLSRGEWIEIGGYIDKEPPAPETSVKIYEVSDDEETGEITLKILPDNGDRVYYEIEQEATSSSLEITDLQNFVTDELKLFFLCVDSRGKSPTGPSIEWNRKVKVKYSFYDKLGKRYYILKATAKNVEIKYSTDGSNPLESGGLYDGEFIAPPGSKYIQAVALNERLGIYSEPLEIRVTEIKNKIDLEKPLTLDSLSMNKTSEVYDTLEMLNLYGATVGNFILDILPDVKGFSQERLNLTIVGKVLEPAIIVNEIDNLIAKFFEGKEYTVNLSITKIVFSKGLDFERWLLQRKDKLEDNLEKIRQ